MSNKRAREVSLGRDAQRENPAVLAAEYNGRTVAILRKPDYHETIASIRRAFTSLRDSEIVLSAHLKEFNDTLEITWETWSELLPRLKRIIVKVDTSNHDRLCPCGCIRIFIHPVDGIRTALHVLPQLEVGKLKCRIHDVLGLQPDDMRLFFDGTYLDPHKTLAFFGVKQDDTIDVYKRQVGGKPVIYLFPPTRMLNVQAELCLVKSWKFSALYPLASIQLNKSKNTSIGERVTWTVDANPDGTLFDHETRREVTYLFWEAHTQPVPPMSPTQSPLSTPTELPTLAFDPARPSIEPSNSVLLPFDKVIGYIDDALLGLGLHTEARTSFITYWLPSLSKHGLIALRFLPQAEYEPAAPLNVTPAPEIMTRVFMLFKGVPESIIDQWESAQAKAGEEASMWRDVVGVDLEKATDPSLFRVLEWGGMEVK